MLLEGLDSLPLGIGTAVKVFNVFFQRLSKCEDNVACFSSLARAAAWTLRVLRQALGNAQLASRIQRGADGLDVFLQATQALRKVGCTDTHVSARVCMSRGTTLIT